jgi:tRNA 2-selenouridine synthase
MASGASFRVPMAEAAAVLDHRPRCLVDLRSPAEFAEDHLPGAVNLPLFDDLERALIGTLYARSSPAAAFEEGRARTLAKIASFTRALAGIAGWEIPDVDLERRVADLTDAGMEHLERALEPVPATVASDAVVAYCWRGGLRSRAVIAFLRGLGRLDLVGIEGGYRAYRRCVRTRIQAWDPPPSFVLRGLTGVGKTLVLRALAERRPEWTLDLEAMAGHRSSILGMVGLEPASQKLFESRLAARIARGFGHSCVVEGESRKVGDLVLPEPAWRAIDRGVALELVADPARRVRVLLDDYLASPGSREELAERLPFIEARLGSRWRGTLVALLEQGREAELVELLLAHYYDPLYRHSERGRHYAERFDARDPCAAAEQIERWIERRHEPARAARGAPALADL